MTVQACIVEKPLTPAMMDKADTVFIGRLQSIGVPVCTGTCSGKPEGHPSLIFSVEKVLRGGRLGAQVEAYWRNGSFGEVYTPEAFRAKYGARSKVGIILPKTLKRRIHCAANRLCTTDLLLPFSPQADSPLDKAWILSDICSHAFVLRAD